MTALPNFLPALFDRQTPAGFDRLLMPSTVSGLFVSTNFYSPFRQEKINDYTIIYLNSWGEMFHKNVRQAQGFPTIEDVKKDILHKLELGEMPENTLFYSSEKDKMKY